MMTVSNSQTSVAQGIAVRKRYVGEVVYVYAYDVAYEMSKAPVRELFGQAVKPFQIDKSKRSPRQLFFHRPQTIALPAIKRVGPRGPVSVNRVVKILPVGAISITVRVPFEVDDIEDLVVYHDLQLDTASLNEEVRQLAEEVRRELEPYYIRPVPFLVDEEAYTVFCFQAPLINDEGLPIGAEAWLHNHRRQVAALLTQESNVSDLSKQEADESTGRYLSYYQNDLVVVDWDAALLIDEPTDFEETLYIMELANL